MSEIVAPPPSVPATLRLNFSWTLVGNVTNQFAQWATVVLIAKLFDPGVVGRYALAVAVCTPVFMFSNLQLRVVQATDAKDDFGFGDFLALRAATSVLALVIVFAVAFLWPDLREASGLIMLVAGVRFIDSLSDIAHGFLQKHERMDRIALSLIMKGPLSLLAMWGFTMLSGRNLSWGLVGMGVAALLVIVVYDCRNVLRTLPRHGQGHDRPDTPRFAVHRQAVLRLLTLTFPLGLATLFSSLAANIPRYFLHAYWGERALGFFAAIIVLVSAGNAIIGSLVQAAYPALARRFSGDIKAFRTLFFRLVGMAAAIGLAGVAVALTGGSTILSVLYRPDYAAYADLFAWLMVAGLVDFAATVFIALMIIARMFKLQLAVLAACVATIAVASFFLVPAYGPIGAAWSLIAGETVRLTGAAIAGRAAMRRAAGGRQLSNTLAAGAAAQGDL